MSESYSTAPVVPSKPVKPYPDFPLFAHASGQWAKKIRGRMHYFGTWGDPDAALKRYLEQKDALHAGRTPRPETEGVTIKDLANAFLNAKQALVDSGELLARTWVDYKAACDLLIARFGKSRLVEDLGPDDFAALRQHMAKQWAPASVRSVIQRVRCVFKFAADNRLIAEPVCYGQSFKRPSPKVLRLEKARQGRKLFTAEEIHRLLGAASVVVKAQILLGIKLRFWEHGLRDLANGSHRLGPCHHRFSPPQDRHSPSLSNLAGNDPSYPGSAGVPATTQERRTCWARLHHATRSGVGQGHSRQPAGQGNGQTAKGAGHQWPRKARLLHPSPHFPHHRR
jgi:hypothetical protein